MRFHLMTCCLLLAGACTTNGVSTNPADEGVRTTPGAIFDACNTAQGTEHPYTTKAELATLVVGRWARCSGPSPLEGSAPSGGVGIQIDADGTYHVLESDGSGGARARAGFGNQGTWDIWDGGPTAPPQFNLHPTPNEEIGLYPVFEDGPRKFGLSDIALGAESQSVYAALPALP